MIKFLYCLIWYIIVPEALGLGLLKLQKENKSMILALLLGYIFEFALFELLAIPMIFMHLKFTTLAYSWTCLVLIFVMVSIFLQRKNLKDILLENFKKLKEFPKILSVILCIIILFQDFMIFKFMHEDFDDADFVAKATVAYDTNTLYEYTDNGISLEGNLQARKVLSPFPIYLATISLLTDIHPAVMAHMFFPVFFIPITYLLMGLIGYSLFEKNSKKMLVFLCILSVIYMFGDYSRYSIFVRLLYRIWQGKSILANLFIPFIFYLFIEYIGKTKDNFYWFVLMLSLWGAVLVSSMSLVLPIITSLILTIIYVIKDKKMRYFLKLLLCYIPSIIYGVLYLIIK